MITNLLTVAVIIAISTIITLAYNNKNYEVNRIKEEKDFERRFYEAVWNINPYNHGWVEEALNRYKEEYDSYYHNPKAIAFLEMMEEDDKGIKVVVNRLCTNYYN